MDAIERAFAREFDRQRDEMLTGFSSAYGRPGSALTWKMLQDAIDTLHTDRRSAIVHADDLEDLRATFAADGLEIVHEEGTRHWIKWPDRRWRMRLYASEFPPERGKVFIIDPDAMTPPTSVPTQNLLTTVTALAMAEVDAALG